MKKIATIELKIPDEIGVGDFEVKMLIASKLYEEGKLSSGQAAMIVGLSKRAFIEILGKYNVSIFGYDYKDLEEELANA